MPNNETVFTCAMCGAAFTAAEGAASCGQCSLLGTGGCQKVRCPRCGYEMPPPARLPGVVKKLWSKIRGTQPS